MKKFLRALGQILLMGWYGALTVLATIFFICVFMHIITVWVGDNIFGGAGLIIVAITLTLFLGSYIKDRVDKND